MPITVEMVDTKEQVLNRGREFEVFTLFPELIEAYAGIGIIARGVANNSFSIRATNFRDFSEDSRGRVDDTPFGGGAGMVIQPGPVVDALEHVESVRGPMYRILLTPSAPVFDQTVAERLASQQRIALICGRYEGIDDRVRQLHIDECLSIGDFVLNGGELAALVVIETVARLHKGVLGNPDSLDQESFRQIGSGMLLEYPQFTRPSTFRGVCVPKILLSGHHEQIQNWRQRAACIRTWNERPDLRPVPRIRKGTSIYFAVFSKGNVCIRDWMSSFPWVSQVFALESKKTTKVEGKSDLQQLRQSLRHRHRGKMPILIDVDLSRLDAQEHKSDIDRIRNVSERTSALSAFDILHLEKRVSSEKEPLMLVFGRSRSSDIRDEQDEDQVDIRFEVPAPVRFGLDYSLSIEESSGPRTHFSLLQAAQVTVSYLQEQGILSRDVGADS